MAIFFEIIKGFFFFLTLIVGILFLRGEIIFGAGPFNAVKAFLMPGYLLFAGLMIGYLVSHIRMAAYDAITPTVSASIYTKSFLVGIVSGIGLAITYIFI